MSVVEDVRNVLQDFLTPELRELKARIEAVEKQVQKFAGAMHEQFQQAEHRTDDRFDFIQGQFQEAERRAERRHDEMSFLIRQGLEFRNLAERIAAIEE
jgi:uncharacterized protein involved in exopolysaccharide biosynthesis